MLYLNGVFLLRDFLFSLCFSSADPTVRRSFAHREIKSIFWSDRDETTERPRQYAALVQTSTEIVMLSQIRVGVPASVFEHLKASAETEQRSLSNMAAKILTDFVEARRQLAERYRDQEVPA